MANVRERSVGLFRYLEAMVQLRTKTFYDVMDYPSVYWFDDIPKEPGCYVRTTDSSEEFDEDVWLEIRKQRQPECPAVPASVVGWVEVDAVEDSSREPELFERRLVVPEEGDDESDSESGSAHAFEELTENPEVLADWQHYLDQKWRPWASKHHVWKGLMASYTALYQIHQSLQRLGEEYELVVALGYLTWRPPNGQAVKRHLLTVKASMEFDANRGILTVRPAVATTALRLEMDMLNPKDRPDASHLRDTEDILRSDCHDPWGAMVTQTIRSLVQSMGDGTGVLGYDSHRQERISATPTATLSPALILRKRSAMTMRAAMQTIAKSLESEDTPIPRGISALCDIHDDSRVTAEHGEEAFVADHGDGVLFPLPANREQARIAEAIVDHHGVLVQGPPGTGKSHTIANLICHLLAEGKRILVTAQTPRALKVLQEKLPPEMSPLCISILGDDRESLEALQASALEISRRQSDWDQDRSEGDILRLRMELQRQKECLAERESRLRELREIETQVHEVVDGVYRGTAQRIAIRVTEEQTRFSWFTDVVASDSPIPFGEGKFRALLDGYRRIDSTREAELEDYIPPVSSLPKADDLLPLFNKEVYARTRSEELDLSRGGDCYLAMQRTSRAAVEELRTSLDHLEASIRSVLQRPLPWIEEAVFGILTDHDTPWKTLRDTTVAQLTELAADVSKMDQMVVTIRRGGPPNLKHFADAKELRDHLKEGGRMGWWLLRPQVVKRTLHVAEDVMVNGRACDNVESLTEFIDFIEAVRQIKHIWSLWKDKAEKKESSYSLQVAELKEHVEALESVIDIESHLQRAKSACAAISGLGACAWHEPNERKLLTQCCDAALAEKAHAEARAAIDSIDEQLSQITLSFGCHECCRTARDAVRQRDLETYSRCLETLTMLEEDAAALNHRQEIATQLQRVAPSLAMAIAESPHDDGWGERLAMIGEAWNWARARNWLDAFFEDARESDVERQLAGLSERIADATADLCAAKAWHHFFGRLTEAHRRYLVAAVASIRKIGKGTGKHAARYRREAQANLELCRDAIPAWVMPLYRVYETMRPTPEMFDVVIVDEASQCGPDSTALLYLAKKVVIVGDNKQISPQAVGIDLDDVQQLGNQHLIDMPMKEMLDVTASLYDRGQLQYGHPIVLREHFRCVPEIIRFSSDLSYRDEPLVPLRQCPPDRLRPIVVRHVPAGYREGSGAKVINRPEAEAVVSAILTCCDDPRYEGLTMGVISLQAEAQARLIESLLAERLDSKELEERRLICGDAYSFQGDERDVIFMSMVAAPNERIGALTKESDQKRFNVAASRARDQVWLFHTAKSSDLSPQCMRYHLLNYYSHPDAQQVAPGGIDVDQIRAAARNTQERNRDNVPSPFDSWFEVDVFLVIMGRGYRVVPQYRVANYRIDLVVEGLQNSLAIECDGDEFHGADKFEEDQARQRTLERCGWRFWRVRGCLFYADPKKALESLWQELAKLDIEPLRSDGAQTKVVGGHVPVMPDGLERDFGQQVKRRPADSDDIPQEALAASTRDDREYETMGHLGTGEGGVASIKAISHDVDARAENDTVSPPSPEAAEPFDDLVSVVGAEGAETWYELSHWARINGHFEGWERSMLYNIAKGLDRGIPATPKQAKQAIRLIEAGRELGFSEEASY